MTTIRALRGATTVSADDADQIQQAVAELMSRLVAENSLTETGIVSLFFTLTPDLHTFSPAQAARQHLGWVHVPILCAIEPCIEGLPERCIRVMAQFETDRPQTDLKPVYLHGAAALRPDLA